MKNATFRLFLLISGLFRSAAQEARPQKNADLPVCERRSECPRRHGFKVSADREVWLQSWTVGPF